MVVVHASSCSTDEQARAFSAFRNEFRLYFAKFAGRSANNAPLLFRLYSTVLLWCQRTFQTSGLIILDPFATRFSTSGRSQSVFPLSHLFSDNDANQS